jgi:ADP-ribosylglycohydrolase
MAMTAPGFSDRFTGCLLGMAIGDALGVPFVGEAPVPERRGLPDRWGFQPRLRDDGTVEVPAGQYSLNSELAFCLLETVVSSDGFVDPELATYRYLNAVNQPHAYLMDPSEARALELAVDAESFQDGASDGATDGARRSAGPAARAVPIALAHALSDLNVALLTREVLRSVLITHCDPLVVNGALAVVHAVRLVVRQELPREIVVGEVLSLIDEDEVAKAIRTGPPDIPPSDVARVVSAAFDAFKGGADQFEAVVHRAVSRGGSAHLTGAIAGALAGAYFGASAIPQRLIDGLDGRAYILMAAPALLRTAQMRAGLFFQLHVR